MVRRGPYTLMVWLKCRRSFILATDETLVGNSGAKHFWKLVSHSRLHFHWLQSLRFSTEIPSHSQARGHTSSSSAASNTWDFCVAANEVCPTRSRTPKNVYGLWYFEVMRPYFSTSKLTILGCVCIYIYVCICISTHFVRQSHFVNSWEPTDTIQQRIPKFWCLSPGRLGTAMAGVQDAASNSFASGAVIIMAFLGNSSSQTIFPYKFLAFLAQCRNVHGNLSEIYEWFSCMVNSWILDMVLMCSPWTCWLRTGFRMSPTSWIMIVRKWYWVTVVEPPKSSSTNRGVLNTAQIAASIRGLPSRSKKHQSQPSY